MLPNFETKKKLFSYYNILNTGIGLMLCMKKLEVKESLQLMNWPRNNIPSGEEIVPLPTSYHLPRTTTTRLKCSGNEYELTATAAHTATTTPMHHDESYGFRGSLPLDVNDEDLKRTLGSNSVTLTRKHFNRVCTFIDFRELLFFFRTNFLILVQF